MFLTQPVSYYPSTPNYGAYPCAIGPHDTCRVSPGSNYYATGSSFQFAADTQDHRQRSLAGDKTNKETTGKKNAKWDHWDKSGAAFLGPQLWDKTIPCDPNLKLEYMDLEDFFDENEIDDESLKSCFIEGGNSYSQAADSASLSSGQDHSPTAPHMPPCSPLEPKHESTPSYGGQSFHAVDYLTSPESCPESPRTPRSPPLGSDRVTQGENVNPRLMQFTDEELKRQPVIRKNRKQYVPNELKDERYWARRRKNNLAAKRSRDARRMKENQIALRAGFLEKENSTLKTELQKTRSLLESMKRRLSAYESVD